MYLRNVLPHAEKHIRCFMLACVADGHSSQDEEDDRAKGPNVVCNLSLADVHNAVLIRADWSSATDTHVTKAITQTALQAVKLSQLHRSAKAASLQVKSLILSRHVKAPPAPSAEVPHAPSPSVDDGQAAQTAEVGFTTRDAWSPYMVFDQTIQTRSTCPHGSSANGLQLCLCKFSVHAPGCLSGHPRAKGN